MPFDPISFEVAKRALGRSVAMYDRNGDGFIEYIQLRKYEGSLPTIGAPHELAIDPSDGYVKVFDPITSSWKVITSQFLGGYSGFDNNGGGSWPYYINIPITTTPSEYAQYKVAINSTNVTVYAADGTQKAQGAVASDFWTNVKSDGSDIRVFDQAKNQLYFWIESWDYTNKNAVIWVKLPAGSTELNIAYGNSLATKSDYENGEQVFEFFDDFENLNKWTISSGSPTTKIIDSVTVVELSGIIESPILTTESGNFKFKTRWKWLNSPDGTISTRAQYGVFDDGRVDGIMGAMSGLNDDLVVNHRLSNSWQSEVSVVSTSSVNTWYRFEIDKNGDSYTVRFYSDDDSLLGSTTRTVVDADLYIEYSVQSSQTVQIDWVFVAKLADPADFGTPQILEF